MEIVFIGGFFPEQYASSIFLKSKLQVQYAANTFQWAFIKGLEQNLNYPIKLLTAPFLGWYPKYYKDPFVRSSYFSNNGHNNSGVMVGFLNLPLIKNIFKFYNLRYSISNLIFDKTKNVIIVYSLDIAFLKSALEAKRKNPNSIVCVIITDPHGFPGDSNLFQKFYLKYIENPILNKLLSKVDCFVLLTDKMADFLKLHHKPWVRVEGLFDDRASFQLSKRSIENANKIVLYTGTLEYPYGIKELLDAFKLIKSPDFRLWICGGGPGANLVVERAKEDERIKYFGIVTKEEVVQLQADATILVNPRNTVGEYNKYSFPSKTIEYLASGTPTLMYKLDGIPSEYFEYCFTVEDNSIESLANAICNNCQLDSVSLRAIGNSARNFIIKNKTAKIQCGKVLNMIANI